MLCDAVRGVKAGTGVRTVGRDSRLSGRRRRSQAAVSSAHQRSEPLWVRVALVLGTLAVAGGLVLIIVKAFTGEGDGLVWSPRTGQRTPAVAAIVPALVGLGLLAAFAIRYLLGEKGSKSR